MCLFSVVGFLLTSRMLGTVHKWRHLFWRPFLTHTPVLMLSFDITPPPQMMTSLICRKIPKMFKTSRSKISLECHTRRYKLGCTETWNHKIFGPRVRGDTRFKKKVYLWLHLVSWKSQDSQPRIQSKTEQSVAKAQNYIEGGGGGTSH